MTEFDGVWEGLTDQREDFWFELHLGQLQWISLDFTIPGCEDSGNVTVQYEEPEFGLRFEGQDTLLVTIEEQYEISIQLALRQGSDSFGQVLFSDSNSCGGGQVNDIRFAPEGEFIAVLPTPTPEPKRGEDLIPEVKVREDLFDGEDGAGHLGQGTIVADDGDWFVVQSHDSLVPVPKGWTTTTTLGEDAVLLFAPGGVDVFGPPGEDQVYSPEPEVKVVVNQRLTDQYQFSAEALADLEQVLTEPQAGTRFELIATHVEDVNRAYSILAVEEFSEPVVHMVIVISNDATADPNIEPTWAVTFAEVTSSRWEDYYPVIQAIMAGWVSVSDGTLRGLELPDLW